MIKFDADQVKDKATQLRNMRSTHDDNITQMRTLITSMCNSEIFEGQAATAYLNKFESMASTFTQFSEMIEEFAARLDVAATTMTETDNALASALNS